MAQPFDASVPSPARIWNYWVGGKDNFEADRAAADAVRLIASMQTVRMRDSRPHSGRWLAVALLLSVVATTAPSTTSLPAATS